MEVPAEKHFGISQIPDDISSSSCLGNLETSLDWDFIIHGISTISFINRTKIPREYFTETEITEIEKESQEYATSFKSTYKDKLNNSSLLPCTNFQEKKSSTRTPNNFYPLEKEVQVDHEQAEKLKKYIRPLMDDGQSLLNCFNQSLSSKTGKSSPYELFVKGKKDQIEESEFKLKIEKNQSANDGGQNFLSYFNLNSIPENTILIDKNILNNPKEKKVPLDSEATCETLQRLEELYHDVNEGKHDDLSLKIDVSYSESDDDDEGDPLQQKQLSEMLDFSCNDVVELLEEIEADSVRFFDVLKNENEKLLNSVPASFYDSEEERQLERSRTKSKRSVTLKNNNPNVRDFGTQYEPQDKEVLKKEDACETDSSSISIEKGQNYFHERGKPLVNSTSEVTLKSSICKSHNEPEDKLYLQTSKSEVSVTNRPVSSPKTMNKPDKRKVKPEKNQESRDDSDDDWEGKVSNFLINKKISINKSKSKKKTT